MAEKREGIPLLVIVGPTASGKTALGIELAKAYGGEIISADSMQLYKGMDIATAKPTVQEQQGIPHHMMDLLEPAESYSVAAYVEQAHLLARQIDARGRLPIVVGGTGLYVSSLVDNLSFQEEVSDPATRERYLALAREKGNEAVLEALRKVDPLTASQLHPNNIKRIVRALEVYEATGKTIAQCKAESRRTPSPYRLCMLGLRFQDRQALYARIDARVDQMMEAGLEEEARRFLKREDLQTSAQAIGYKELKGYFNGTCTLAQAVETLKRETRRYAKRQMTWFQRDSRISWIDVDREGSLKKIKKKSMEIIEKSAIL